MLRSNLFLRVQPDVMSLYLVIGPKVVATLKKMTIEYDYLSLLNLTSHRFLCAEPDGRTISSKGREIAFGSVESGAEGLSSKGKHRMLEEEKSHFVLSKVGWASRL